MVVYYKLFDLLKRKNMKVSDLRNVISSATVAKLNKGQHISGECIDKICRYLECQPSDIMEIVESDAEKVKREKVEKVISKSAERFYNFIMVTAKLQNKDPKEIWQDYLAVEQEKKKDDVDFKAIQKYVETRIAENEE